jgi:hypothetical protein
MSSQLERDLEFYKRILIQACLSNGNKIDVDPLKARAAQAGGYSIEFGNGKITLLGSEHSLFPNEPNKVPHDTES